LEAKLEAAADPIESNSFGINSYGNGFCYTEEHQMRRRTLALAAIPIVLATACAQHRALSPDLGRDRLDRQQEEFIAALANRDAERMTALFAEDAVLHVANMPPIEGRDAIGRFYGNLFRFLSASAATPERLELSGSGDMAYEIGKASNEFRGPQGTMGYTGKYLLVWRRIDGDWRIVLYSVSSNESERGGS
jgi:ketosteroid isomerase-like protein